MTWLNRLTTKSVVLGLVALVRKPLRSAPRSDRALHGGHSGDGRLRPDHADAKPDQVRGSEILDEAEEHRGPGNDQTHAQKAVGHMDQHAQRDSDCGQNPLRDAKASCCCA